MGKTRNQLHSMSPWHIRIGDPLQDAHRASGLDQPTQQKMPAAVLDECRRDWIGLCRILRWTLPHAFRFELSLHTRGEAFPHQLLGEVHGWRDQNQRDRRRRALPWLPTPELAHE